MDTTRRDLQPTINDLWIRVNYSRLTTLQNLMPDELKKRISHNNSANNVNKVKKRSKEPKLKKKDKLSKKNSRGSSSKPESSDHESRDSLTNNVPTNSFKPHEKPVTGMDFNYFAIFIDNSGFTGWISGLHKNCN
jgi:hypothetical protein